MSDKHGCFYIDTNECHMLISNKTFNTHNNFLKGKYILQISYKKPTKTSNLDVDDNNKLIINILTLRNLTFVILSAILKCT